VIKHEFIHHILFLTTGNMDLNHNTEWFIKCGGLGEHVQRSLRNLDEAPHDEVVKNRP
jgi:hypothetical protein